MLFFKWSETWLNNLQVNSLKPKTYEVYGEIINNHLIPYFYEYELDEINISNINSYIALKKKTLTNTTINLHIALIKLIFKNAFELGIISVNKMSSIKRLKNDEKQITAFSINDEKKIIKYCLSSVKDYEYLGIVLCFYTGLRIGELLSLTWDDIDLKNKTMFINKNISRVKINGTYQNITTIPKTSKSRRTIPICNSLVILLKKLKIKHISNYVISAKDGKQMLTRTYQHIFKSLQKKVGITKPLNFHSIRHTFATRAIESGMDVKTLSELLGHSNTSITLNRYVHSMFETKKKAMEKLSKMIDLHSA